MLKLRELGKVTTTVILKLPYFKLTHLVILLLFIIIDFLSLIITILKYSSSNNNMIILLLLLEPVEIEKVYAVQKKTKKLKK